MGCRSLCDTISDIATLEFQSLLGVILNPCIGCQEKKVVSYALPDEQPVDILVRIKKAPDEVMGINEIFSRFFHLFRCHFKIFFEGIGCFAFQQTRFDTVRIFIFRIGDNDSHRMLILPITMTFSPFLTRSITSEKFVLSSPICMVFMVELNLSARLNLSS